MGYLRQYEREEGYCLLTGENELDFIEFGILHLGAGASFKQEEDKNKETGLILLKGKGKIRTGNEIWEIERESVFAQKPYGIYVPQGVSWTLEADEPIELAVAKAPSKREGSPVLISPDMIEKQVRGKDHFRREVYNIILENVDAERLIIGETINFPGEWSSFPPHKHDTDNLPEESKLEEFYLFKIQPDDGFGFGRLYTAEKDLDEGYVIKNNSYLVIPRGYHPISAMPGSRLYYLWILAGEKRKLVACEDPAYSNLSI